MNKSLNIKTKYNILMNKKYIDIEFYTNTKIIGWTYFRHLQKSKGHF